jgi:hypothetical protein
MLIHLSSGIRFERPPHVGCGQVHPLEKDMEISVGNLMAK